MENKKRRRQHWLQFKENSTKSKYYQETDSTSRMNMPEEQNPFCLPTPEPETLPMEKGAWQDRVGRKWLRLSTFYVKGKATSAASTGTLLSTPEAWAMIRSLSSLEDKGRSDTDSFLESSDGHLLSAPSPLRPAWVQTCPVGSTNQWGQRPEAEKQDGRNPGPWGVSSPLPRPQAVTPGKSQPLSCLTLRSGVSFRAGRTTLPSAALKSLHTDSAVWGGCALYINIKPVLLMRTFSWFWSYLERFSNLKLQW